MQGSRKLKLPVFIGKLLLFKIFSIEVNNGSTFNG
jgi:hypothetical protein